MRIERHFWFWSAAALVALLLIWLLNDILLPFITGIGLAYFLNPLAARLESWGIRRLWASALIVLLAGSILVLLLILIGPLLIDQFHQFAAALPGEMERFRLWLESWARERLGDQFPAFKAGLEGAIAGLANNWTGAVGVIAQSIWSQSLALVNFVSLLLVTPVVMFYMLVDWQPMLKRVDGWLPREQAPAIRNLAGDVNAAVSAFIRGQGTICLILGVVYAIGLTFIGIKYGLLIGLVTGLLCFIPFVGWAMGVLLSSAVAVAQFWPETLPLIKVVALFAAVQALDASFLSPKIVGSKIGLHPVWLIFSLFVFGYLFGFVGVLVAVPMAAALGVLVRFGLRVYMESEVYEGEEAAQSAAAKKGGQA